MRYPLWNVSRRLIVNGTANAGRRTKCFSTLATPACRSEVNAEMRRQLSKSNKEEFDRITERAFGRFDNLQLPNESPPAYSATVPRAASRERYEGLPVNGHNLSTRFDEAIDKYDVIFNKMFIVPDAELEPEVLKCATLFAKISEYFDDHDVFESYKNIQEVPTDKIKYLILDAYYGLLTKRIVHADRDELLKYTTYYFRNFIMKCKKLGLTIAIIPHYNNEGGTLGIDDAKSFLSIPLNHLEATATRQYQLSVKVGKLKPIIKAGNADEITIREYYLALVEFHITHCLELLQTMKYRAEMLGGIYRTPSLIAKKK